MKMVAAAKVKKAESTVKMSRPFTAELNTMFKKLLNSVGAYSGTTLKIKSAIDNYPALLQVREVKSAGLLVITSNKGLAGAYNANISKYATMIKQQQSENRKWIVNPRYCVKYNLSAKAVRNMIKKKINDDEIGLYYDCSKTISDNLILLKQLGLKVGKSKLYMWCKENEISTKGYIKGSSITSIAG